MITQAAQFTRAVWSGAPEVAYEVASARWPGALEGLSIADAAGAEGRLGGYRFADGSCCQWERTLDGLRLQFADGVRTRTPGGAPAVHSEGANARK